LVFTAILFIFALVIVITSFSYGAKARLIPFVVAIIILAMAIPLLINEVRPIKLLSSLDISLMDIRPGDSSKKPESDQKTSETRKILGILAWMGGFFVVVFFVGFHIGIFAFALTFLKFQARQSWSKASITAVIIRGITFLLFEVGMGFSLFKGVFFGEILPRL